MSSNQNSETVLIKNNLTNRFKPTISIVIPCLNEEESLEHCITQSFHAIDKSIKNGEILSGEVIVADNGSKDRSVEIAKKLKAIVINVKNKGYGNALKSGIAASTGEFILVGDADGSYDFSELPKFIRKYNMGNDLVMGCRFAIGGGQIDSGAMPTLHKFVGNPLLTTCSRFLYSTPVNDIYCGLRGISRSLYDKLDMRCDGMEFAVEMVVKSTMLDESIAQVPITLSKDLRTNNKPHLKTFKDGWRTLRYLLLSNPKLLVIYPGLLLIFLGCVGYYLVYSQINLGGAKLEANTLLIASLLLIIGVQNILFGLFSTLLGVQKRLILKEPKYLEVFRYATLGKGIILAGIMIIFGISCITNVLSDWHMSNYTQLNYSHSLLILIPGITSIALAVTSMFFTFTISLLQLEK